MSILIFMAARAATLAVWYPRVERDAGRPNLAKLN
jgi:hypothetical protein